MQSESKSIFSIYPVNYYIDKNISTDNENIYFNNGNYLIQISDKTF